MDVDPLFGTVIRGKFSARLGGRRLRTNGVTLLSDALFHVAARGTFNSGAGGHRDTESGLTKVNDALFPTRSLSSFSSHFSSSFICSFCLRRVSCMRCLSVCHSRWASSLLLGSTRGNSLSWGKVKAGLASCKHTVHTQTVVEWKSSYSEEWC